MNSWQDPSWTSLFRSHPAVQGPSLLGMGERCKVGCLWQHVPSVQSSWAQWMRWGWGWRGQGRMREAPGRHLLGAQGARRRCRMPIEMSPRGGAGGSAAPETGWLWGALRLLAWGLVLVGSSSWCGYGFVRKIPACSAICETVGQGSWVLPPERSPMGMASKPHSGRGWCSWACFGFLATSA